MPLASGGSTQDAAPGADEDRGRVFPCEGCGADLTFNIGTQSLKCPYCGFTKSIELDGEETVVEQDLESMLRRVVEQRETGQSEEEGLNEVRCESCGATVRFPGTLTSMECAYCGVPIQLDGVRQAERRVPVDGVLAFQIDREEARSNLAKWVRTRWFAPNDFKKRGVQGRFNGIYLPYWTFDSLTFTRYSGMRGEHYWVTTGTGKNKRRVRRTRWYPASGSFQRFFDDVLVLASTGVPTKRLVALEPWPLNECAPFAQEMLAGFLARTYDIPLDEGLVEAKERMTNALEREVRQRIGGDVQRIHSIHTRHDAVTYKHLLLPVWMLAYRYGKKSYQVVVNAGTGEVQGDRPYSWIKIALAMVAAAVIVVIVLWFMQL
jgi:DNA-directed RNA polymerase subunit RPC12/RpoP